MARGQDWLDESHVGRSIASTLSDAGGAIPVILYREDDAAARAFCREIANNGGKAGMYKADLANAGTLGRAVRKIEKDVGGVDILVNNAASASRWRGLALPEKSPAPVCFLPAILRPTRPPRNFS